MKKKNKILILVSILMIICISLTFYFLRKKKLDTINNYTDTSINLIIEGDFKSAESYFEKTLELDKNNKKILELKATIKAFEELQTLYNDEKYEDATKLIPDISQMEFYYLIEKEVSMINNDITARIKLLDTFQNAESQFEEKNYYEADRLIKEVLSMDNYDLIQEQADVLASEISFRIQLLDEIDSLDSKIKNFLNSNSYDVALDLVNRYDTNHLPDTYIKKLSDFKTQISASKKKYDDENRLITASEAEEMVKSHLKLWDEPHIIDTSDLKTENKYGIKGLTGYRVEPRYTGYDDNHSTSLGFYFVDAKTKHIYELDVTYAKYHRIK